MKIKLNRYILQGASLGISNKESSCNTRDVGLIPESGRSPGGGHGNPPQYSCLENPMDRGAWWATVLGVTESETTEATEHAHIFYKKNSDF